MWRKKVPSCMRKLSNVTRLRVRSSSSTRSASKIDSKEYLTENSFLNRTEKSSCQLIQKKMKTKLFVHENGPFEERKQRIKAALCWISHSLCKINFNSFSVTPFLINESWMTSSMTRKRTKNVLNFSLNKQKEMSESLSYQYLQDSPNNEEQFVEVQCLLYSIYQQYDQFHSLELIGMHFWLHIQVEKMIIKK